MKPSLFLFSALTLLVLLTANRVQAQPNTPPVTPDVTLCSVMFEPVSFQLASVVTDAEGDALTFSITQLPDAGDITFNPDGSFYYASQAIGYTDYFVYTACDAAGLCSSAYVYINLAEMETLPPIEPTLYNYTTTAGSAITICEGNIGWAWANNCITSLYTVCINHNQSLGQITYLNDNCITYQPLAASGTDTITMVGCGDAPPPIVLTCNGWEQMDMCSHTWFIVSISPDSGFTETHTIHCDSTLTIGQLGYPTWVTPTITSPPANGSAGIVPDGLWSALQYTPNIGFTGADTVVVACAQATQLTCQTGTYIFTVDCTNNLPPQPNGITPSVSAFFNPATNQIEITTTVAPLSSPMHLWLYNLTGTPVSSLALPSGQITSTHNALHLPAGLYLLHWQSANFRGIIKLPVVHW